MSTPLTRLNMEQILADKVAGSKGSVCAKCEAICAAPGVRKSAADLEKIIAGE